METKNRKTENNFMENIFKIVLHTIAQTPAPSPKPQGDVISITNINIVVAIQPNRKGFFKWLMGLIW
ncbi:MAG: hypothetical protein HY841_03925 [Bacteroidetes bacterium]|nr:hypothetical protein [Bacteroidota bacterium]